MGVVVEVGIKRKRSMQLVVVKEWQVSANNKRMRLVNFRSVTEKECKERESEEERVYQRERERVSKLTSRRR